MSARRRGFDWPWLLCVVCFLLVMALGMWNAVLYSDHPHGRGLNLFAAVWCALMAAWTLYNCVRLWTLRDHR